MLPTAAGLFDRLPRYLRRYNLMKAWAANRRGFPSVFADARKLRLFSTDQIIKRSEFCHV
jgi:hypothetical protein